MSDEDTYIFSVPYYKNESDLLQLISEASISRRNMCHCNNNNPYTCVKWNEDTCLNCQPKDSKENARKFRRSYSKKKWLDHHNFVKTIPESLLPGGSRFSDIKIDTTYLEKVAGMGLAECWPRNINDVDCYWQLPNDYAIRRKYSYSFFKYLSSKILKTRKKLQLYSSPTQRSTEEVFETSDSLSSKFKETQIRSRLINPLNMERELGREWEAGQFYPKNEFVEVNNFFERVEEEEDMHAEEQADSDVFATIKLSDPIKSARCPRFLEGRECSRSCSLVHRFPKEDGVVCKHFNTKLGCSRDPCPYLHNTEERVNTVIEIVRTFCSDPYSDDRCIAMLKGGICSNKRCDKLHRYPKDDGVYCQYYLTTSCRYGPKCTFLHEKVDEAHLEHAGNADLDTNILSRASVKTEDETFSPAKNNSYEDSMALSSNGVSTTLNYSKNERLGELSTLNDVLRGLSEVSSNDSLDERSDDSDDERPRYSGVGSMLPIFKAKRANQYKSEAKSTLRTSNTATLDNTFGNENYKNSLLVNSGNIAEGSTVDKNSCKILNNTVERKAESCNGLDDDDSDNERPRYSGIADVLSLFRGKKAEQNRKKVKKNPRILNGRNSESTPKSKCISGNRNISETLHNIPVDASDSYIGSDHEQPMCSGVKKQTNTDEDSRSSDDTVIFSNYSESEENPVKFSNMGGIFPAFQKNKAQKSVQISESKNRKNSHTIQSPERNRIQSDSSRQKYDDLNTIGNYSFHTNDKSKSKKILGYKKPQTKLTSNESLRSPPGDNNRYLKQSSHERNFPKGFMSFQSDEIKNVVPSLSEPPKGKATSKEPEMDIKSNWSLKKISAPTPKTSAVEKPSDSNISNNSTSSNKRKVHYDDMENVTLFHPKSSHTKHASLGSMKNFKIPKIPTKQKETVTKNSNPNRTPRSEEKSKNITKLPEAVAKDFKLGCNPNKKELSHIRDETRGGIKPCIVLLEKEKFVGQKDKQNSINHKNINKQKTPFNHDVHDSQLSGKSKTDLTLSENDRKRKQIEFQSKDNYHDINITKIKKSRDEPSFPLEGPSHFKSGVSSNTDKQLVFEPNTSSMEVNNKSTLLYEQRSPKRLKFENDLSKADISTPERSVDSHSKKLGKHDLSQAKSSSKLSEDANHKNIGLRKNDSALAKPSSFTLFEDSNPKLIRKDDLSQVKSSSSKSSENNNSKDNRKNYSPTSTSKLSENASLEHAKKCDFLQAKPSSYKTSSDSNPKHIKDDLLQTKLPSKQSVGSCHDTINRKHSSSKTNLSELEAASHSNKEPIKKEYDNSDDIIEITSIKLENVVPEKSVVSVSKAEDSAASGSKGVMKEVASGKCDKSCRKRTSSIRKLKDVTSPVVEKDQILIDKKDKFNSEQIMKSTEDINTKTMKLNESFKIKEEPRIASEKLLNQPLKNSTRCPTSTEKNVSPNSPSDNNLNKKGRIVSEVDNVHGNQNRKNQSSSDSGEENVPPSGPSELESNNYDEIFITGEIFNNGRNFIINTAADFLRNFGIKFDRSNIYQRFIELCSSYQIDEFEKDLSLPALDRNIRRFATALLHRKHYLDSNSSNIKFDIPLSEYLETLQRLDSIFASSSVNSV